MTMSQPKSSPAERLRLDLLLVQRGAFASRSRARDAIARGTVTVDGVRPDKAGALVSAEARIEVDDAASDYVSRSALKLIAALDRFGFDPAGRIALDVGASTGGFTQVLLERGASHVHCIDVGHGQLHPRLAADPRVSNMEGLNARDLEPGHLGHASVGAVVGDVSFISLKLALPPALRVAAPGAFAALLVKPQFEAGRHAIGKGGLVKDRSVLDAIAADLSAWLGTQPGWRSLGTVPSPIAGGDGNEEFLLGGAKA